MDGQNLAAEPTGYLRDFRRLIDPPIQRTAAWTEASTRLRFVVEQGRSDVLVGPPGSGKTTLLRELAIDLERAGWRTSRLELTGLPTESLPARIADALGLGLTPETPLPQVWRTLTEYCEGLRRCERTRVLVLDHADQCAPGAIDDVKGWLRISGYAVSNLLAMSSSAAHLAAELQTLRIELPRLTVEETRDYVLARLAAMGIEETIPAASAVQIHEWTTGLPRRINQLCELVELVAETDEVESLDSVELESLAAELKSI